MAIAFGASGTKLHISTATTAYNVPYPTGITSGQLLVLFVSLNGGSGITSVPSGWTTVYNELTLSNPKGGVFYKIADGTESGTLALTIGSAVNGSAMIFRYTGVDTTTPLDVASSNVRNTTAGTTTVIPSVTTVTADTMLIFANAINSSSVLVSSTSGTERADFNQIQTGGKGGGLYDEARPSTGATGTRTISSGSNLANWGVLIALRPAGVSGPAYSASVAFGGVGSLSAATKLGFSRPVSLAGSGVLSAVGVNTTVIVPYVDTTPTYTAPYVYDAEERIRYSARHIIKAIAYPDGVPPVELLVEDASVSFDDGQVPRIQASLTCAVPEDKAALAALDSRKTYHVEIYAGYKWNSVEEDIHLLAKLHARNGIEKSDNTIEFTLHSGESQMSDYKRLSWDSQPPQTNLLEFVAYHVEIANRGSEVPEVLSDFKFLFGADAVAGVTQKPGQDSWKLVEEAARRAGASVYCESDGTWRIAKPQALSATTSLKFNTGADGIITEYKAATSRDNFSNAVCIEYKWRDANGDDQIVYGNAVIDAGPLAIAAIGYNVHYETREIPVTQAQANAAATSLLISLARRGRSFVLEAISAYWLRPGQSITVNLPEGEQERLLVSAVYFNFPSGQMSVRLRQPEDIEITTTI